MPQIRKEMLNNNMYKKKYISVNEKFWLSHLFAFLWMAFSIIVSIPWLNDLASIVSKPIAFLIIAGIGYVPGYINLFTLISLLLDRQPDFKTLNPLDPVTIIIACRNEEKNIADTLFYIKKQDYQGKIHVIIVDNGSTDITSDVALNAGRYLNLSFEILFEDNPGK